MSCTKKRNSKFMFYNNFSLKQDEMFLLKEVGKDKLTYPPKTSFFEAGWF